MTNSIFSPQRMSGVVFIYLCLSYNIYPALQFAISISKIQFFNLKTLAPGSWRYQTGPLELKHCKYPSQVFFKGCLDSRLREPGRRESGYRFTFNNVLGLIDLMSLISLYHRASPPGPHPHQPFLLLTNPSLHCLRQSEYR